MHFLQLAMNLSTNKVTYVTLTLTVTGASDDNYGRMGDTS